VWGSISWFYTDENVMKENFTTDAAKGKEEEITQQVTKSSEIIED
jgi:hypothetical protein